MLRKQLSFLLIFQLLLLAPLVAQHTFESILKNETKDAFYNRAHLAVSVRDVETGQVLASYQGKKWMVPASSLKLITTLAAYDALGPDFRFETSVCADGHLDKNGVLHGHIIIKGGGDPTLGSDRINGTPNLQKVVQTIVEAIQQRGIRQIEGTIIIDESIFSDDPVAPSWQWNDIGNYYGGGAWGLNILENEYKIYFQRDKTIGSNADIQYIDPYVPDLKLDNQVIIDKAGTGDNAYIFEGPGHFSKSVRGTIPYGKSLFPVRGALPDPPAFLAYRVQEVLKKAGIHSSGIQTRKTSFDTDSTECILTIQSPPLHQIIKAANTESINLYCEAMLKIIGFRASGKGSRWEGIQQIQEICRKYGLNPDDFYLADGSGLSVRNQIPADFFTSFLQVMMKKHGTSTIAALLPLAGKEGTVKSLLEKSPAIGKVRAKSGSLQGVYTLTGYLRTSKGKDLVFCCMINGSPVKEIRENRQRLEKIIEAIYNFF